MTSHDRHELRYQRRKLKRDLKKASKLSDVDNFDKVFTYENLYAAYKKCRRGVSWKASVQRYIATAPLLVYDTYERLQLGTYKCPPFFEFDIHERGKVRHIRSTKINERVVQRCLCDNCLIPAIESSFIYDNGASRKRKGYTFAVNRLNNHLESYIRKNGTDGYILLGDFSKFFESVLHSEVEELLRGTFTDEKIIKLTLSMVYMFDESSPKGEGKGLGLGSQVSQILAPAVVSSIDHIVKDKLRIKYYGRYMDDFYIILRSKEELKSVLTIIDEAAKEKGLKLNLNKTHIVKLTHGFTFLKVKYNIEKSGRIIHRIDKSSITRERRKLKKFHLKYIKQEMTYDDCWRSFQSWKGHTVRLNAYNTTKTMTKLFYNLFGMEDTEKYDLLQDTRSQFDFSCIGSN